MARTNKYTSLNFNDIYEKKIINPNNNKNNSSTSTPSKSSSSSLSSYHKSYSLSASSRIHGNMLVLSRPSPRPQPQPPKQHSLPQSQPQSHVQQHPQSQTQQIQQHPQSPSEIQQHPPSNSITPQTQSQNQSSILSAPASKSPESISLRPKGNTGGSLSFQERENKVDVVSNINNNNNNYNNSNKFVPPHLRPGFVPKEVPVVPEFQKPRQGNHRPISAHGNFNGSPNRFVDDGRPKTGGGHDRRMRGPGPGPMPGPTFGTAESNSVRPRSGGSRPSSSGCDWQEFSGTEGVHRLRADALMKTGLVSKFGAESSIGSDMFQG